MRPISLDIKGFGPFAGEVKVEFGKLGRRGVYLISGKTGSGKTTIFDAVSFALFGEASGNERDSKSFRSHYSKEEETTEVKFRFEFHGRVYEINRNPEYIRKSKRGDGITKEIANASLVMPDKSIITGNRQVTEKVVEILGIDRKQFAGVAMIAQGSFRELLFAKTEERRNILKKIYDTKVFANLQEGLKQKTSELEKKYRDAYEYEQKILKDRKLEGEKPLKQLEQLMEQNGKSIRELEAEAAELKKAISKSERILKEEEERKKLILSLNSQSSILETITEKKRELSSDRIKIEQEKEEIQHLKEDVVILKSRIGRYDELEQIQLKEKESKRELERLEQKVSEIQSALEERNNTLEESKIAISHKEAYIREYECCNIKIIELNHSIDNKSRSIESIELIINHKKAIRELIEKKNRLDKKRIALELEEAELFKSFVGGQAGLLAEALEDGKPCPVCGAEEHPRKAEISCDRVDESILDDKRSQIDDVKLRIGNISDEAASRSAEVSILGKSIEISTKVDGLQLSRIIDEEKEKFSNEKAERDRLKTELSDLEEKNKSIEEKEKNISTLNKEIESLEDELRQTEILIAGEKQLLYSESRAVKKLQAELNHRTKQEACNEIIIKTKRLERHDEEKKRIEQEMKKLEREETETDTLIKATKQRLTSYEEIDVEKIKDELSNDETGLIDINKKLDSIKKEHALDEDAYKKIEENKKSLKKIDDEYGDYELLSKVMNGNMEGKDKISLETHVQRLFFKRILSRANRRLRSLSGGRYELLLKTEAGNKRSQSGLDLDIFDSYTGSCRDVRTLSGGESFEASLSLALGLSDQIQSYIGGIELDAIFIDEGFGSLDQDSLKSAVNMLSELSESDVLVGIISHVEELKERIDKKIVVNSIEGEGSCISMEI